LAFAKTVRQNAAVYILSAETLKYKPTLEALLQSAGAATAAHRLEVRPALLLVMSYDLLFGHGKIDGGGKVKRLLCEHEAKLRTELARLKGKAPLRVEGTFSSGPWFLRQPWAGWINGSFLLPGRELPLELLRERVIDAWVASYQPDLPDPDDPQWWVLDLVRQPVRLLAAPNHPLVGVRRPSADDLGRFPSLALPAGWFPRTEAILRGQGLWQEEVRMSRYDPADWEGRCGDGVTLTYGQSLTEALQPTTVRLDWDLGLITGEALVVRRDLVDQPAVQQLVEHLLQQARLLAARFDDVELVS
jgi:hypothetical protein